MYRHWIWEFIACISQNDVIYCLHQQSCDTFPNGYIYASHLHIARHIMAIISECYHEKNFGTYTQM